MDGKSKRRSKPYDDPNTSIGYLTRITFQAFSRNLERRTLPDGVTAGQWRFLRALWNEEGCTQHQLSLQVGTREPATVTALNGMERAGLVRRVRSADDRRKIHIFLTPRARRLRDKLMPFVEEVNLIAARGIGAKDLATVRGVLRKMMANLAADEAASESVGRPA